MSADQVLIDGFRALAQEAQEKRLSFPAKRKLRQGEGYARLRSQFTDSIHTLKPKSISLIANALAKLGEVTIAR